MCDAEFAHTVHLDGEVDPTLDAVPLPTPPPGNVEPGGLEVEEGAAELPYFGMRDPYSLDDPDGSRARWIDHDDWTLPVPYFDPPYLGSEEVIPILVDVGMPGSHESFLHRVGWQMIRQLYWRLFLWRVKPFSTLDAHAREQRKAEDGE